MVKIIDIEKNSIAHELGIQPGSFILEVNGHEITDRIDYRFYCAEEELEISIRNEIQDTIYEIEKDADEDIGLVLEEMTMRSCGNRCVFCFVHQNPKGLRRPLYFKDEDYRFSFLYGHYVTMTTMTRKDLERIVEQRLSPLYISVHATEEKIRKYLLGIKEDDGLLEKIEYLTSNGIILHTQIVLCPEKNDGKIFDQTVNDLKNYYPGVKSIAVVPVGLTQHRKNLPELRIHSVSELQGMIDYTNNMRVQIKNDLGVNFVYLADEFFIKAKTELPPAEYYDEFYQIENGVGEFRDMIDQFNRAKHSIRKTGLKKPVKITWVTGELAADPLSEFIISPLNKIPNIEIDMIPVKNNFYGNSVHVSGLLVGQDIYEQLKSRELGDMVLLPPRVLNDDGLLLDDWTVEDLSEKLNKPVHVYTEDLEQLPYVIESCLSSRSSTEIDIKSGEIYG